MKMFRPILRIQFVVLALTAFASSEAAIVATHAHSPSEHRVSTIHFLQKDVSFASSEVDPAVSSSSASEMEASVLDLVRQAGPGTETSIGHLKDLINKTMLPQVLKARESDQAELNKLAQQVTACDSSKNETDDVANVEKEKYETNSPLHKECRTKEAALATEAEACKNQLKISKEISDLKCKALEHHEATWGSSTKNADIVQKIAAETPKMYMKRVHDTFCGGSGNKNFYEEYLELEEGCTSEKKKFKEAKDTCRATQTAYMEKSAECDGIQKHMDESACNAAVLVKDTCESYAACYASKKLTYLDAKEKIAKAEEARKSEYRALMRMMCLIDSFKDGKVEESQIDECKAKTQEGLPTIEYPELGEQASCEVPDRYPGTGSYLRAEFAPLPALAKGKVAAYQCHGLSEISLTPKAGSPSSCKCSRVTLNGHYSAGALVKCTKCRDVSNSLDKDSCPEGTKIFSPRSKQDWMTVIASAGPLRSPNFIVDVTRPEDGQTSPENSESSGQTWVTSDGSPWWLRSSAAEQLSSSYSANCYLDLIGSALNAADLKFDSDGCAYHSDSYFCQKKWLSTEPKRGSPATCHCSEVQLTGRYSPGALIKCVGCLEVKRSTDKDSCPDGTKIFSPRSREDWKTIINSVVPLRSPSWIVDVTRPSDGCGACDKEAMNFDTPGQASWRTQDGSPWWLRSTKYHGPDDGYKADCYMNLWKNPSDPDSVSFKGGDCESSADSYYCQPRAVEVSDQV